MCILWIDLTRLAWDLGGLPDPLLGGRALTAALVREHVSPECHPLGPGNLLVVATGPLAGYGVSCGNRLSVGAKSPLTGGIKEANAGGTFAEALASLGLRAVALRGRAPKPVIISLAPASTGVSCEFHPAGDAWGKGNYAFAKTWVGSHSGCLLLAIGPAGERMMKGAGVACTDLRGRPSRFAARGGLGAVLGSKLVEGIAITPGRLLPGPPGGEVLA